ncbi:YggS family pyridoxal phosphate-dependent enzyme [Actinomyces minihominis]|uniref:YggS family pyridoxal phosphate-dependent enzyme n=1 Tax=Actinomyces minihominis TaxID=2002838 RepID=UPI000C08217A|nr:YggS family pyridoxal phosphate-dependent enzyme [Actinomyces minihominis]
MSPTVQPDLSARLEQVRQQIALAAQSVGRNPAEVRILPVTKYTDEDAIRAIRRLGFQELAENRVQQLTARAGDLAALEIDWVLIGHLQTNKAAQAVRVAQEVQSVDSVRVANALSRHSQNLMNEGLKVAPLRVLLQVNTSGERAKSGFEPDGVRAALAELLKLPALNIAGFMTMAPLTADEGVVRKTFADLRGLREELAALHPECDFHELSMGMSQDYRIAIEEGATTVRLGSVLFG